MEFPPSIAIPRWSPSRHKLLCRRNQRKLEILLLDCQFKWDFRRRQNRVPSVRFYPLGLDQPGQRHRLFGRADSTREHFKHLFGRCSSLVDDCQWRSKKGPPWRCKKGPLGGCGLVPVVHGRAPRATRRALNRLTRRRAREGPVGPRGQAWAGWSVQLAVGV